MTEIQNISTFSVLTSRVINEEFASTFTHSSTESSKKETSFYKRATWNTQGMQWMTQKSLALNLTNHL